MTDISKDSNLCQRFIFNVKILVISFYELPDKHSKRVSPAQ